MWPDRVSNPEPLTYVPGALPIALRRSARVVLGQAHRGLTGGFLLGLTGGFLLLRFFSVGISVSPHVCFILDLILISMFL